MNLVDLLHVSAERHAARRALTDVRSGRSLSYGQLDALMDRVAAALQRDGLKLGDAVAVCAASSVNYAALFLGALRAGVAVAPLAPSSTPASLARMTEVAGGKSLAPEELPSLMKKLHDQPAEHEVETQVKHTYWDTWPFLLAFVSVIGTEWFLRKKWGLV